MTAAERDYSHRSRLDKLGVRAGSRVRLLGLDDPLFAAELAERGADAGAEPPLDLVFIRVEHPHDLDELTSLRALIREKGAIWVLRRKGNSTAVGELDIIEAGKRHRLVDNKVVGFSETLSAIRLVIPVAQRSKDGG